MDSLESARRLVALVGDSVDFSRADRSFSPFFSDVGLVIDGGGGVASLCLHYNRVTTELLRPFLSMPRPARPHECRCVSISQHFEHAQARIAFCDHNTWVVDCRGLASLEFGVGRAPHLTELRCTRADQATVILEGYLPSPDARDPDPAFPIILGVRIIAGSHASGDGGATPLRIRADADGTLVLAFSARMLDVARAGILERLRSASACAEEAVERSVAWLARTMGDLEVSSDDSREATVLARAAYVLACNATMAPGMLGGRVAAFPNRGRYPAHFLWDSCFQNLALESMERRLAEDSLLLLTENLRSDGKMPQFLCSTWSRPQESQPPLVGWAGLRLVQRRNDARLADQLLPALHRNTAWWLSQRMSRFGLVIALSGYETGWDDSPRFDRGATVACDTNSYLVMQMRACAQMSRMLGDERSALAQEREADVYAQRMVEVLYDSTAGLFWDLSVDSGSPVRVKTPACFLPILAGVPLSGAQIERAAGEHLLNPDRFFGEVPFPSVAYDEACYDPRGWWRGPMWPPVAYLMLLVLDRIGHRTAAAAARRRLYRTLVADGGLRELYDSRSGEGLGAHEQSWSAAICLRLREELA